MTLLHLLCERSVLLFGGVGGAVVAFCVLSFPRSSYFWVSLLVWCLGLVAFLFLTRAYFAPYILTRFSNHIRVRSVSLRSIRGLYFRKGNRTWQIDRFAYAYSPSGDGKPKGLSFRIDGFKLEIELNKAPQVIPRTKHRRGLTLTDLSPSPLALYIWSVISTVYLVFDPIVRPATRFIVTFILRQFIRLIPRLTETLQLEVDSAVISFTSSPEMSIVAENITLKGHVSFVQNSQDQHTRDHSSVQGSHTLSARALAMGAWKSRLANNFQRTWIRAWDHTLGSTTGSVSFDFVTQGIEYFGFGQFAEVQVLDTINLRLGFLGKERLVHLSGPFIVTGAARFSPKDGTIKQESLRGRAKAGAIHANIDSIQELLSTLPIYRAEEVAFSPSASTMSSGISPWIRSPFSASSMSPVYAGSLVQRKEKQRTQLLLGLVESLGISLGSFSFSKKVGNSLFRGVVQDVFCSCEHCDTAANTVHRTKSGQFPSPYLAYRFSLAIQEISLRRAGVAIRGTKENSPFFIVGSTSICSVISDWPAITPVNRLFCGGIDACVMLDAKVASVSLIDRLDNLLQLTGDSSSEDTCHQDNEPILPAILSPVPRIVLNVTFGNLSSRVECANATKSEKPITLELESKGMVFQSSSSFQTGSTTVELPNRYNSTHDHIPLRMSMPFHALLHPIFLRLRSTSTPLAVKRISRWGPESTLSDTVFSLDAVEVKGTVICLGESNEEDQLILATLNTRTLFIDVHCCAEAALAELWHPRKLEIVGTLLSLFSSRRLSPVTSPKSPPILPIGYSVSLSIARAVLFVTGPDINPAADKDITRGIALSTGISLCICSVGTDHIHTMAYSRFESENRQKLFLPLDRLADAISFAKASELPTGSVVFGKLLLWNTSVRSAAADGFSMDDPLVFERDNPSLDTKRIAVIRNIDIDIKSTARRSSSLIVAGYDASFIVDDFTLFFELSLVYSALTALQTLQCLQRCMGSSLPASQTRRPPGANITFHGTIKTVRARLTLLDQTIVTRVNHVDVSSGPRGIHMSIDSSLLWVPVFPPKVRASNEPSWEELGRIHNCVLSGTSMAGRINVTMDSLRIRIPYGYVLAELSQAMVVTMKAIRHLAQMVTVGEYAPISTPIAEGAKGVPDLVFSCRMLCLEAADDPLESRLAFNYRIGLEAAKSRLRREEAFDAKAAAIVSGLSASSNHPSAHTDYQFNGNHSVSIQEARWRLDMAHSMDWMLRHKRQSRERSIQEELMFRHLYGSIPLKRPRQVPDLISPAHVQRTPPLLRIMLTGLRLHLDKPSFPLTQLSDFLYEQGNGLPRETLYSLLVPLHLAFALKSLQVSLRDYPLPLLCIPPAAAGDGSHSLVFDSDLVVAEEMGPVSSVEWVPCPCYNPDEIAANQITMLIKVPKTLMPVKTYARPSIQVSSNDPVAFAWGVSYSPAIQDVVRMLESLTPEPRDPSPSIGFWDKNLSLDPDRQLRLIFHWKIRISFNKEVRLRDPYVVENEGAGFAFCWEGEPQIKIGFDNSAAELVQVTSETMLIVIPKFDLPRITTVAQGRFVCRSDYSKVCAKLSSGTMFGVGVVFERTCRTDCKTCTGSAFDRLCRMFTFRPHYDVQLVRKSEAMSAQTQWDSYREFRSDFLHLSISLTSGLHHLEAAESPLSSSLYLTPKAFTNFWSWWGLFDNDLSPPIRQGSYYPHKPMTPKFSRHLGTIKYRVSLPQLFITHAYLDDTKESWVNGTTCFVGMKAMVDHFQADLHQREQETIAPGSDPGSIQVVRHKPFYAAEVIMKDLDVRVMQATFSEPLKQAVPMYAESENGMKRNLSSSPQIPPSWIDNNDFVETDWSPQHPPDIQLLPVLSCPKLTYFKRHSRHVEIQAENSKFGDEDTHACMLGCEPSVPYVEISLAEARISVLQRTMEEMESAANLETRSTLERMVVLLREYVAHLREVDQLSESALNNLSNYYMPSELISASEWADFENVYQVHAPNLFMCDSVRNLLIQYYNCSRARRGFEYHMATRAVKFIRDQADALALQSNDQDLQKPKAANAAQVAASALRRILTRERGSASLDISTEISPVHIGVNPLDGWDDGIILRKSHFCLLLKPQIILRTAEPSTEVKEESTVVLAAVQAKLQSFKIMDVSNLEDPISGTIMTRYGNYMALDGLQTFCPTGSNAYEDGAVPLEVLIDYRCENDAFDRIVPQTNATCQYDRFNRLRLRNNVTSTNRPDREQSGKGRHAHLSDETDLIRVHVPQFTVSANDRHFQFISDIITNLILFSDAAHKARLEKLETLLFAYDFTDLRSAAMVVSDLQNRLRNVLDTRNDVSRQMRGHRPQSKLELFKLQAHMHSLAEELNLIFEAIRLVQSRTDGSADKKSALLLHASSSEISWRMLDEQRKLLAKFAVRNTYFSWLSKQDSSTVSSLTIGDLQVFDGSPQAIWTEIVSRYEEPSNHPLSKRDLFLDANWIILAPVGGITIYEKFQVDFHPIRLQLDAHLGQRIMEYIWPARRGRKRRMAQDLQSQAGCITADQDMNRSSLDSSPLSQNPRTSLDSNGLASWKKLGGSRSCIDLRSAAAESSKSSHGSHLLDPEFPDNARIQRWGSREDGKDDAVEMKSRSSQKTFILVKISSLELLLSIMKAESFECRDARIRTHTLEIRNETWSFEELVDQFIPTDLTWKGWVRMAFHQPFVPVLPVARELFSKTKLIASKGATQLDARPSTYQGKSATADATIRDRRHRKSSSSGVAPPAEASEPIGSVFKMPVTEEPEAIGSSHRRGRARLLSMFSKRTSPGSPHRSNSEQRSSDIPSKSPSTDS
ncbi:golgi-body localization protein domain-containing protein [Scleroderma citrinum]